MRFIGSYVLFSVIISTVTALGAIKGVRAGGKVLKIFLTYYMPEF
jgi:hypothetical protein